MTKQEEIRGEIILITKNRPMAYQLIKYLHSQGVVIKVGDDIDIELTDGTKLPSFTQYEPLIKGEAVPLPSP